MLVSNSTAYIATANENEVRIVCVMLSIENGVSSQHSISSSSIQLGTGQVRDVKFLDESRLFVLWEVDGSLHS